VVEFVEIMKRRTAIEKAVCWRFSNKPIPSQYIYIYMAWAYWLLLEMTWASHISSAGFVSTQGCVCACRL
jgi:hypothetical protein